MMNQIFSFKRFGLLFKKHTIENYKTYLMSLVVLIGIVSIIISIGLFSGWPTPMPEKTQVNFYLIFLLISGTIFTSNVFINLGDKRKAIATLTLPASNFEKFLVGWLYSFVIFLVLYIAIFYGVLVTLLKSVNWHGHKVVIMDLSSDHQIVGYVLYTFLHAVVLYGAVYFKKMHFIKTAFAFFIAVMIIWGLNYEVLRLMTNQPIQGNPPFSGLSFKDGVNYRNVELSMDYLKWLGRLFVTIAVIIWSAAYFRLKEKQV